MNDFIINLGFAFLFGLLIGIERQVRHKLSGIVTNVLVSVGACLFLWFADGMPFDGRARLAAQVISGIGFLGGGVIIRDGFSIRGINTAATIWCSAAIGLLCSQGEILFAFIGTLFIIFSNVFLKQLGLKLEHSKYARGEMEYLYRLRFTCNGDLEPEITSEIHRLITPRGITLKGFESRMSENPKEIELKIYLLSFGSDNQEIPQLINHLKSVFEIKDFSYQSELQ